MVVKKAAVSTRVQKNKDKQLRESGGDAWFNIEKLVLDDNIYPRRNVLTSKVNQYYNAMKLGQIFPAIAVETRHERPTGRILDGWHRYHAYLMQGKKQVTVVFIECSDEIEALRESYTLNNSHGLQYSSIEIHDYVKTATDLGMTYDMIADDIKRPVRKVESMVKQFGTAKDGDTVALKRGLRHLNTNTITKKQEALNKAWMGSSAGTYAALLFRYLDANAINTEDTKLIKALDKLTDKWLQVRKSL